MHWNIIVSSSGNDAMLSVTARMLRRERSCKDVIVTPHPTPPYPLASGDDAMLSMFASLTRILVSESRGWWLRNRFFGCGIVFFWLRNRFFGFGIVFFWFRNRLFLVAFFGCGIVFFWLRNRRNLVAEASKFGC